MDVNVLPLLQPEEEVLDDTLVADDLGETGRRVLDGEETTGGRWLVVLHDRFFARESTGFLGGRTLLLGRLTFGRAFGIAGTDHLEQTVFVDDFDLLVDRRLVFASLGDWTTVLHLKTGHKIGGLSTNGAPDDPAM